MAQRGFTVSYEVHDEAVQRGLREQRRMIGQDIKRVAFKAAWVKVVPAAKALAPSFYSRYIVARSTTRGAYLTTAGPRRFARAAGLLEFGGTRRDRIEPLWRPGGGAKALKFGGRFVAYVDTPRVYSPKLYMTKAVVGRAPAFQAQLDEEMTQIMRRRIQYARTF